METVSVLWVVNKFVKELLALIDSSQTICGLEETQLRCRRMPTLCGLFSDQTSTRRLPPPPQRLKFILGQTAANNG